MSGPVTVNRPTQAEAQSVTGSQPLFNATTKQHTTALSRREPQPTNNASDQTADQKPKSNVRKFALIAIGVVGVGLLITFLGPAGGVFTAAVVIVLMLGLLSKSDNNTTAAKAMATQPMSSSTGSRNASDAMGTQPMSGNQGAGGASAVVGTQPMYYDPEKKKNYLIIGQDGDKPIYADSPAAKAE